MAIQERVQSLEDLAAVDATKMRQMRALDALVNDKSEVSALESELTSDFQWRCAYFGTHTGWDAYQAFVHQYMRRVTFSLHFLSGSATRVSTDRDEAEGEWVVWQPFTLDNRPWVLAGRSSDRFVRQDDRWLVSATTLAVEVLSPWPTGWGEDLIASDWQWQGQ